MATENLKKLTVGAGCFWCIEAVYNEVKGVSEVVSGYSGGNVPGEPTYREICSGLTGHAEVVQVVFDTNIISYEDLLVIFMTSHDPTTLNRQGADVGTQYRSVIYYHDEAQKKVANAVVNAMQEYYDKKIVTEISAAETFYKATEDHQNFYANNKGYGYCTFVIDPKLSKLRKMHADKLKSA